MKKYVNAVSTPHHGIAMMTLMSTQQPIQIVLSAASDTTVKLLAIPLELQKLDVAVLTLRTIIMNNPDLEKRLAEIRDKRAKHPFPLEYPLTGAECDFLLEMVRELQEQERQLRQSLETLEGCISQRNTEILRLAKQVKTIERETLKQRIESSCIGYPDCDGNLPGEPHSDGCPAKPTEGSL